MFKFGLFLVLAACAVKEASTSGSGKEGYYKDLKKAVSPDIVDDVEHDIIGLVVKFANVSTLLGNELKPSETKDEPIVDWHVDKDKEEYYTISMTDPDAPSRENPRFREWQHWLVVNIPSNKVHMGEYLTEYNGPTPPPGTGLHRYCVLLFKQSGGKMNFDEPYKGVSDKGQRKSFNTREFTEKYKLGKAVGGNFFVAQAEAKN